MSMSLNRNGNGYDISSQNYFKDLSKELNEKLKPAAHQSVSDARGKIKWEGFEYLLGAANLEKRGLPKSFKFKGHVTRGVDGTSFYTPRTEELLEYFTPRNTCSQEGQTHYPYGLCVTAVNVYTGQPVCAVVDDYDTSEREGLKKMLCEFSPGDLSLLDRGLGGKEIYFELEDHEQFFIHRAKTSGDYVATYIQEFLESGKKQTMVEITMKKESKEIKMDLRLILGPIDSEGKPIVFVTNLLNKNRYKRSAIIQLYNKRWACETLYDRVKNLLCLEKFHGRSYNGIMQEIFANLLALSLTALAVSAVIHEEKLDPEVEQPNFKNANEVVRRHLFDIIDKRITGAKSKAVVKEILKEVGAIMYKVRPGRSYPRVSMQPIKIWNLKKSAKLRAFQERLGA